MFRSFASVQQQHLGVMVVSPAEMVAASNLEVGVRAVAQEVLAGVAGGLAAAVLHGGFDAAEALDSAVLAGDGIRLNVVSGAATPTN